LEHIDGNAYNNSESNLSLLCPNCHSQTPTYKAKNKGNGRVERRERAKKDYHRTLDK
jgi:predicted HNH restriction endonuclease